MKLFSGLPLRGCLRIAIAILGLVWSLRWAFAQDVSVGEPQWFLPTEAPDQLPKTKGHLSVSYPAEMKKSSETGYAIALRYLDETGKNRSTSVLGSHVPFQRAVEGALSDWKMTEARDGSKSVGAWVWVPIIFNPKAASDKSPEAIPRLLKVAPVVVKNRPTPKGQPPVVRMKLQIDVAGAVVGASAVSPVQPPVEAAIRESVEKWQFTPARKDGKPVAGEIELPVICQPPAEERLANRVPPKASKQVEPEYPFAMRRFGLEGRVRMRFEIEVDGSVKNPVIVSSDNPAFDEPALKALLQWKYRPATEEGRPVKSTSVQEIHFHLNGRASGEAFTITGKTDQAKLPPEFRYDTRAKIRNVLVPVYPTDLRAEDVRGKAKVGLLVSPQGKVIRVEVHNADRPEFGLALTAAAEGFLFDPAIKDGRPTNFLLGLEQEFSYRDLPDFEADAMLALEKKHPEKIVSAAKLDQPLKIVSRKRPIFPTQLEAGTETGSAVVEFLVDENGKVRVPRIVQASQPAFGYSAVQAVSSWWFEPPKSGGKNVVVRVQAPIKFAIQKSDAEKADGK